MRFKSLGSGSAGNATVIEAREHNGSTTRILVDCGFSQTELVARLAVAGLTPSDLSAIFITHEHTDHMGCAQGFSKRWQLPLWMSHGTALSIKPEQQTNVNYAYDGQPFEVGAMRITPFTVPHDAREPLQIKVDDGETRMAILTDLGRPTDHVIRYIYNCHALILEANHEPAILAKSSYPPVLKKRIMGVLGHLSNQVAADVLREVYHSNLRKVVAAHLSEKNNLPALVHELLAGIMPHPQEQLCIADADTGTPWQVV